MSQNSNIQKMKILSLQERVDFVEEVAYMCLIDGIYQPALFEVVFRLVALKYFADVDYTTIDQDKWPSLVYNDFYGKYNMMDNVGYIEQSNSLMVACGKKIDLLHIDEIAYAQLNKRDPLEELVDMLKDYLDKASKELSNVDLQEVLDAAKKFSTIDKDEVALKVVTNTKKPRRAKKAQTASVDGSKEG